MLWRRRTSCCVRVVRVYARVLRALGTRHLIKTRVRQTCLKNKSHEQAGNLDCNMSSGQDVKAQTQVWPKRPVLAHSAAEVQLRTTASAWDMSHFCSR